MLNFIKHNLHECSENITSVAFQSLVYPILYRIFISSIGPFSVKDIQALEEVQRRAACFWVVSDYSWSSRCLTKQVGQLWLNVFFLLDCALVHNLSAPQMLPYYPATYHLTCQYHPLHFMIPPTRTNYYTNIPEQSMIGTVYQHQQLSWIQLTLFTGNFFNCADTIINLYNYCTICMYLLGCAPR